MSSEPSFDGEAFLAKARAFAASAGRKTIEIGLTLYYALIDADTPAWARTVIIGALSYFLLPVDAIPDLLPGAGYVDDAAAVAGALTTVAAHIKKDHRDRAEEVVQSWFG